LMDKYSIRKGDLKDLTTSAPFNKKIIEVMATIINENDNNLTPVMIYTRIRNLHNI